MTMTPTEAQARAAQDMCWAMLRDHEKDITRIALNGPSCSADGALIQAVFMSALGDLLLRRVRSESPPDDEEDPGGDWRDGQDGESGARG